MCMYLCYMFPLCKTSADFKKACMFTCLRAVIGEIDEETDSALDLGNIRAEPLNSVAH